MARSKRARACCQFRSRGLDEYPGSTKAELEDHLRRIAPDASDPKAGCYLNNLVDRYRLVERRQPIFASPSARRGRYYVGDISLNAWLGGIESRVNARPFRPLKPLLDACDRSIASLEGFTFEKLVRRAHAELSRKGRGDFELTHQIEGYWDRSGIEIDVVLCNADDRVLRLGSCKRNQRRLVPDIHRFARHVDEFLQTKRQWVDWRIQRYAYAPTIDRSTRRALADYGIEAIELSELLGPLRPGAV